MRKFAIVLTALAASLLVGTTANAQSFSSTVQLASHHRGGGSVDIRIGGGGFGIGVHSGRGGWDRGGWGHGGWDRGGWDHRGPVYRYPSPVYRYPAPVYRYPAPVYRDPCGYDYDYGCGAPSTITVRVQEVGVDAYGRTYYTGRTLLYTAWYDSAYGGYVYRDQYGRIVRVR